MVQAVSFIKKRRHTDAREMWGDTIPETEQEIRIWNAIDRARTDTGEDKTMIQRYDLDQMISIDHYQMEYTRTRMGLRRLEGDEIKEAPLENQEEENAAQGTGLKFAMTPTVKITVCDEEKVINGWLCRKYLREDYGMTQEIWATEDVAPAIQTQIEIDPAVQEQLKASFGELPAQEYQDEVQAELNKIRGYEIVNLSEVANVKTTIEVISIEEIEVEDDLFEAPEGYLCTHDKVG
jgi:hypothetical protein